MNERKVPRYLIIAIIVFSLFLIPSSAYAWPEPKRYPEVYLVSCDGDGCTAGTYQGARWTFYATDKLTDRERTRLIPPQLNLIQANRWRVASPAARPRLAELYGVSKDVAEQYGANYIEIRQPWEDK